MFFDHSLKFEFSMNSVVAQTDSIKFASMTENCQCVSEISICQHPKPLKTHELRQNAVFKFMIGQYILN